MMLKELNEASKEVDGSFVNQQIENFQNIDSRLGPAIPGIYTGGIFFGVFVTWKSIIERKKLGKFLFAQYVIFGTALSAMNYYNLKQHYKNKKEI